MAVVAAVGYEEDSELLSVPEPFAVVADADADSDGQQQLFMPTAPDADSQQHQQQLFMPPAPVTDSLGIESPQQQQPEPQQLFMPPTNPLQSAAADDDGSAFFDGDKQQHQQQPEPQQLFMPPVPVADSSDDSAFFDDDKQQQHQQQQPEPPQLFMPPVPVADSSDGSAFFDDNKQQQQHHQPQLFMPPAPVAESSDNQQQHQPFMPPTNPLQAEAEATAASADDDDGSAFFADLSTPDQSSTQRHTRGEDLPSRDLTAAFAAASPMPPRAPASTPMRGPGEEDGVDARDVGAMLLGVAGVALTPSPMRRRPQPMTPQ